MGMILSLIIIAAAYFLGSVSSAIIVSKVFSLPDPCESGSKNPGATNVFRLSGKKYGAMVLFGDLFKGFLIIFIAQWFGEPNSVIALCVLAVVAGHIYPIYYKFAGGKGVATAFGCYLAISLWAGLLFVLTWLVIAKFSKYSSLASMITVFLAPFYLFQVMVFGHAIVYLIPLMIVAVLIIIQHFENIKRLMDGEESKIDLF